MPRFQATVSLGTARQVFDLDADVITVGRDPGSTLVLPMAWVSDTQVRISHGNHRPGTLNGNGNGHARKVVVSPGGLPSAGAGVTLIDGAVVPHGGVEVGGGRPFVLDVVGPGGGKGLNVVFEPMPDPVPVVDPGRESLVRRLRGELLGGAAVLAGAILLAGVLAGRGSAPARPAAPSAGPGEYVPGEPVSAARDRQAEAQRHLDDAAIAYAGGDLVAARAALDKATVSGASGAVTEALGAAVRAESERRDRAAAPTTAPVTQPASNPTPPPETTPAPTPAKPPVPNADERVEFEGRRVTPKERDDLLRQRAAEREARRQEAARKEDELRRAVGRAEADAKAGREVKLTELGRSALKESKARVRERLGKTELTFPEDLDPKVLVVYADGVYTIRGYADQYNRGGSPVRVFYLTRLRPTGPDTWEHLGTDLLQ